MRRVGETFVIVGKGEKKGSSRGTVFLIESEGPVISFCLEAKVAFSARYITSKFRIVDVNLTDAIHQTKVSFEPNSWRALPSALTHTPKHR